jgi:hypothetical protein
MGGIVRNTPSQMLAFLRVHVNFEAVGGIAERENSKDNLGQPPPEFSAGFRKRAPSA